MSRRNRPSHVEIRRTLETMRTAVVLCLLLIGCSDAQESSSNALKSQVAEVGFKVEIFGWDDPVTGCKYFYNRTYSSNYIVTPRYWANGQPMCPWNKP